jgi:AraC-like DNA-binding protein
MFKLIRTRLPQPALRPFIQYFYSAEREEGNGVHRQVKPPSGQGYIVFCVQRWDSPGGSAAAGQLLVSGPNPSLMPIPSTSRQFVGAKVLPGAFRILLGEAAKSVKGLAVPLSCFWGRDADILLEKMCLVDCVEKRWDLLEGEILGRVRSAPGLDPYAKAAASLMEQSGWKMPMGELSSRMGYTDRQIRRMFDDGVGLSPKEFQRVSRCRALILKVLQSPAEKWAQRVEECGYFDQAHLIHEFKSLVGQAPEKFLESLRTGIRPETALLENGRRELFVFSYPS